MGQRSGDRAGRAPAPRPLDAAWGMVLHGLKCMRRVKGLATSPVTNFDGEIGRFAGLDAQLGGPGALDLRFGGPRGP
eukprot:3069911-Pyramimonas_sp.AAC.1